MIVPFHELGFVFVFLYLSGVLVLTSIHGVALGICFSVLVHRPSTKKIEPSIFLSFCICSRLSIQGVEVCICVSVFVQCPSPTIQGAPGSRERGAGREQTEGGRGQTTKEKN